MDVDIHYSKTTDSFNCTQYLAIHTNIGMQISFYISLILVVILTMG